MGKAPLFVRPPTDAERQALEDGRRASDAFVLRRAQILLASAQGDTASVIAPRVGFSGQAVRDVIHAFNVQGVAVLRARAATTSSIGASIRRARRRCAMCCTAARGTLTDRPASGRWSWPPRSLMSKA